MTRTPQQVALAVKRLQNRHHRALTAALAPLGVSLVQWDTLRHLHAHPDASLHDLAQLTFQTDQAFGTLAARMAARGLIERVPGPGRAVRHALTPHGEEIRQEGERRVAAEVDRSLAPLAEAQLDQLGALLEQVLAAGES
ncbi:MarR family winged helix-turn-helix transcriptional regulator [Streptomyces sp. NPDC001502]|uniref:MarR family winged helix-turn-helix transcriptional regulator n=1 Tax=Streptomyces sp. NPDC001502 TaxID=3364578 RepID=UPI00369B9F36